MEEKKNSSILIIILVLILVAGAFFWWGSDSGEEAAAVPEVGDGVLVDGESNDVDMMDKYGDDMSDTEVAGEMKKAGSYEVYSSEKLMTADSKTILFFKATWCPSCRALDKALDEEASEIPEGVTILEVDYDSAEDLRKKYGVTTQHTLVQVDENGELVHKWSGSPSLSSVVKQIK